MTNYYKLTIENKYIIVIKPNFTMAIVCNTKKNSYIKKSFEKSSKRFRNQLFDLKPVPIFDICI